MAKEDDQDQGQQAQGMVKPPDQWATGDQAITGPQASYLDTLITAVGGSYTVDIESDDPEKPFPSQGATLGRSDIKDLTKADSSLWINVLQEVSNRDGGQKKVLEDSEDEGNTKTQSAGGKS